MSQYHRDIILYKNDVAFQLGATNTKVDSLNELIAYVDNANGFCKAHELVNRNRITSNRNKILNAVRYERLKPFRFLINKN